MKREFPKLNSFAVKMLVLVVLATGLSCSSSKKKFRKMVRNMPYGSSLEVEYAGHLWKSLKKSRLVGKQSLNTTPQSGEDPHGVVVETLSGRLSVLGQEGQVYVLRNYFGKDITRTRVAKLREKYLNTVTVMFQREHTYDPSNKNWFWAEFQPDGKIIKKINGLPVAGRVARGEKNGCISCHAGAPGGDFVFSNTAMKLEKDRL